MPQGHYVLILMVLLLFGTLLEPPLEIVFRTCILHIIFMLIITHPLRSDLIAGRTLMGQIHQLQRRMTIINRVL